MVWNHQPDIYIYILYMYMVNVVYRLMSWDPIVIFKNYSVSCKMVGVGLYCEIFFADPIFPGGVLSIFVHLSLGNAGPFTVENHIHVKALKMQGSPNN